MKKILFRTSEDNYTFCKEVIGFENIDRFFNEFIEMNREHTELKGVKNGSEKQY